MPNNEELLRRIEDLEAQIKKERADLEPILNLYNAGIILGRVLVILGGVAVGVATIWQVMQGHIK